MSTGAQNLLTQKLLLMIDAFAWSLQMSGQHVAACYFMWPIAFQDGHEFPAYVQRERLIELMVQMEAGIWHTMARWVRCKMFPALQAAGIPSRFPHESHLYKIFASKEWGNGWKVGEAAMLAANLKMWGD